MPLNIEMAVTYLKDYILENLTVVPEDANSTLTISMESYRTLKNRIEGIISTNNDSQEKQSNTAMQPQVCTRKQQWESLWKKEESPTITVELETITVTVGDKIISPFKDAASLMTLCQKYIEERVKDYFDKKINLTLNVTQGIPSINVTQGIPSIFAQAAKCNNEEIIWAQTFQPYRNQIIFALTNKMKKETPQAHHERMLQFIGLASPSAVQEALQNILGNIPVSSYSNGAGLIALPLQQISSQDEEASGTIQLHFTNRLQQLYDAVLPDHLDPSDLLKLPESPVARNHSM